jgi:hypothetical protein
MPNPRNELATSYLSFRFVKKGHLIVLLLLLIASGHAIPIGAFQVFFSLSPGTCGAFLQGSRSIIKDRFDLFSTGNKRGVPGLFL